MTQEETV